MPRFTRPSMTPSNSACASPGSALTGSSSVPSSTSNGCMSVIAVLVCFVATLGPEEQDPGGKVVAEVLETMFDAGRHEQHFARREVLAAASAGEFAAACDHHVDLV